MFDALGLGGGNSVCPCVAFFECISRIFTDRLIQLLAGLAIVLGIPFPVWLYFNGEKMRAKNPLTKGSTTATH